MNKRSPDVDGGGQPAAQVVAAANFARLFGRNPGFDIILVALGTTSAAFSMAARLDDPKAWGTTEFLAVLGFGALQIVLGCIDRLILPLRSVPPAGEPRPLSEPPAGETRPLSVPPAGESPPLDLAGEPPPLPLAGESHPLPLAGQPADP